MKMTTHLTKVLLLICAFLSLTSLKAQEQQREVIDKVIAMVGGEFILLSELEDRFAQMAEQATEPLPREARCSILDQVLVGKLLYNQSKLDSIEVSPEEVESQLNARIERILSYMNGNVEQFEEFYGQSITASR
jgi:peptidyl-prolyl cis-trans isomerase SurA